MQQASTSQSPSQLPAAQAVAGGVPTLDVPFDLALPAGRVENMCRAERESTPPAFAFYLVEIAKRAGGLQ